MHDADGASVVGNWFDGSMKSWKCKCPKRPDTRGGFVSIWNLQER